MFDNTTHKVSVLLFVILFIYWFYCLLFLFIVAKLTMMTPQDKFQCVAWFTETRLLSMPHREWIIISSWYGALRSLMLCCIPWSFLQNDTSNFCELLMPPTYRWSTWWCPSIFYWKITLRWKVCSGLCEAGHILRHPLGWHCQFCCNK